MAEILIDQVAIQRRVRELGAEISGDYEGRELDLVCLINGAGMFCADLLRHLRVPVRQHFLGFTSYARASTSGEVRITLDVPEPLESRHVLVLEGIVVSGRTPGYILNMLKLRQPASIALCAFGVKRASVAAELSIDYWGFELGPEIAVGYGIGHGVERSLPALVRAT